jgi:hypothetical protein
MKLYKLGRKPGLFTAHAVKRAFILARHLDLLGAPPAKCPDYCAAVDSAVGGNDKWGLMGNDDFGDCTFADGSHQIMLHTANAGSIFIPTVAATLAGYSLLTGFNENDPQSDDGANESDVCTFMIHTGIAGHKSSCSAPIDPTNVNHLKWAVILFGCVRIGIQVPSSCEDQFAANQPWDVVLGDTIEGGHDVPITYYETLKNGSTLWEVSTWGRGRQPMTDRFRLANAQEAHGEVYYDWMKQGGTAPSGFQLNVLQRSLVQLQDAA